MNEELPISEDRQNIVEVEESSNEQRYSLTERKVPQRFTNIALRRDPHDDKLSVQKNEWTSRERMETLNGI